MVGGIVVLLGWLFDVRVLKSWEPYSTSSVPIAANAAVAVFLGGVSLVLQRAGRPRGWLRVVGLCCAALMLPIGLATFAEYLVGWDIRIDPLLFHGAGRAGALGWPESVPAIAIVLAGLSLLVLDREFRGVRPAQLGALAVGVLGFYGICAHLYAVVGEGRHSPLTAVALPAGLLLGVLALAIVAARPRVGMFASVGGAGVGGRLTRRLVPLVLLVPILLGSLAVEGHRWMATSRLFAAQTALTAVVVLVGVLAVSRSLDLIDAERWARERRWWRLAENVADMIVFIRLQPEPVLDYVSPAVTGLTGYAPEEFYADPDLMLAIVHPDDRAEVDRMLVEPVETFVWRLIGKDGRLIWLEQRSAPVYDEGGELVAIEGIARDITEQKQAQDVTRESEARLRLALDAARMLVWSRDLVTDEMTFDGDFEQVFGRSEPPADFDELLRRIHPDDVGRLLQAVQERFAGSLGEAEVRILGDDGAVRWAVTRGVVIRDDSGEPVRMIGTGLDITERKQVELALEETSELLGAIVSSTPAAIVATDLSGKVTIWNQAAERLFGWRVEEVRGGPIPFFVPEEVELMTTLRERVIAGGTVSDIEARRLCKDGTVLEVLLALTPLRNAAGEIAGVIGTMTDISEQIRSRRQLQESLELLRSGDEERRRLLGRLVRAQEEERLRISSDIHDDSVQVLTALTLRLELLGQRVDDPELLGAVDEVTQTARNSIETLRHLIFELRPPALDRDGLASALRLYLEQMRQSSGIEFALKDNLLSEPGLETRAIVYRIVQEALVNVVKHARASRVELRLDRADDGIRVRVVDDGSGFPIATGVESKPGHVGLIAMRERAELAGGWWRIRSTEGTGTEVEFSIPDLPGVAEEAA